MSNEVKEIAGIFFKDEKARQEIEKLKANNSNYDIIVDKNYDIIVDKNGSGDYTTLTDAVVNATEGQKILVKKGTYDDEIVNCVGKYLIIVGEDKEETIIQNSYDDYYRPPLNIGKGIIKNLTFKQIGSLETTTIKSYAAHIDNTDLLNNKLYFENCYFYSLTHAGVGVGLYNNCELKFKDCIFRSDHLQTPQGEHRGALFIHNANNNDYAGNNQRVILENCKLSTLYGSVLHFEHCLGADNVAEIEVYDTKIYSDELGIKSGLITQELNSSATDYNIILSNKSSGNNYPTLNASKYQVNYINVIGKYKENGVESEIKRILVDIPVNVGTLASLSLADFNVNKVVGIQGILTSADGGVFPLSHNGDNAGNNISCWANNNEKTLSYYSYLAGTITVTVDYI